MGSHAASLRTDMRHDLCRLTYELISDIYSPDLCFEMSSNARQYYFASYAVDAVMRKFEEFFLRCRCCREIVNTLCISQTSQMN